MDKALRIGVTGAGAMGTALSGSARNYGAAIVGVHDVSAEPADKLANVHTAKATTDLQALMDIPMDGLIIAAVPTVRIEPVTLASAKGIHLMIEKPPAYSMKEGRECRAAIDKAGVIAAVGFQLRYDPRYERMRELMADHEVHLVRTVCTVCYYLTFEMSPWFLQKEISGGPIAEQAIHLLDCVRYLLGNPAARRAGALGTRNMALDRTEFNVENAMQIMYELDGGILGVHTNHCGHREFHFALELVGPQLRLQTDIAGQRINGYIGEEQIDEEPPPNSALNLDKVGAWLRAIETGDRSLVRSDYTEALHTQALVDAAIQSQTSGRIEEVEQI